MDVLENSIRVEFTTIENGKVYKDKFYISKDEIQALFISKDEVELLTRYANFKETVGLV